MSQRMNDNAPLSGFVNREGVMNLGLSRIDAMILCRIFLYTGKSVCRRSTIEMGLWMRAVIH